MEGPGLCPEEFLDDSLILSGFYFTYLRFRGGRNTTHQPQKRKFCVRVSFLNACQCWFVA